ncbi:tannase/feruloyl esterase family alpha/beta hydrolase [Caldimonas tepidiphila]|uniref:tannase/feruloyl esterase family alpha/beta hydrolase n=1 Tax=Caldimonas tepidiphila TaxID=2315841 RepID=UPI000E5B64EF|nr:tannase/feruloyl esterase family alpha/beta hydrolase [Caldimonas tepidiphila]
MSRQTLQRGAGGMLVAGAVAALSACGGSDGPTETAQALDCAAIARMALPATTLTTETIAANTQRPPGVTSGEMLVEHCRVSGTMNPRTGVDGKPYAIGFELRMPAQNWNGRFLFQGGGGNDGVVRPAVGPQATPRYALNRGFAVVTTDAGHQGTTASFGADPLARIDHAYNSYDKVAVTAKELISQYYRRPADRSYFVGCSGGGRQGMMFSQRFPGYFDGILAMAPAMRVAKGATIAAAWDSITFRDIAPAGADGRPVLSQALTNGDLQLLRDGILSACDAQDGANDGLVSRPAACGFDPGVLQCSGAKNDSCLSPAQVGALRRSFAGPRNSAGQPLYFSWPWDPGVGHPDNDWRAWRLGTSTTSTPNSRHVVLMNDALANEFLTPPDPGFSIFDFNFDTDPARLDAYASIYNTGDDVQLAGFKARGGKLLLAHGMADPIFSPHEVVDYYQRLQTAHGPTQDLARLFLIPGMGHCSGGAGTDVWDGLGALVDWVEKGGAPQQIVASGTRVFPGRTRPLCAYPAYAHYKGSGSIEDAANFECRQP